MEHDAMSNSSSSSNNNSGADEEFLIERALMQSLIEFGSADAVIDEEESTADLAARRQRHRDTMARYRRRKKAGVAEMKVEEQFLVAQLQSMLTLHASQSKSYRHTDDDRDGDEQQQQQVLQRTPMDAFVEVLTESERLHFENLLIKQRLADSYKFEKILHHESELELLSHHRRADDTGQVTGSSDEPSFPMSSSSNNAGAPGRWIKFVEDEPPFFYVPFTQEECEAHAAESRRKLELFTASIDRSSLQFGDLLGWDVSTALEWDESVHATVLRLVFRKMVQNRFPTLEALVDNDWRIIHDARIFHAIHSGQHGFQVLQSFSDRLSVVIWSSPSPDHSLKNRILAVYARGSCMNHEGKPGFRITSMSVLPKVSKDMKSASRQMTAKGEPVRYASELIMQTVVTHSTQEGYADFEWSGRTPVLDEEHGRFLMVELGNILVRMETLVLSKRVLPPSEGP